MRRLTHVIVLAAFVLSCGGQWVALQGIAWVNMIHAYSQMVPMQDAIRMTFSGQHPCAICKVIAEKKQSENQKLGALGKYDKKFFPPAALIVPQPQVASISHAIFLNSLRSRAEAPPTPPPRRALA